MAIAQTQQTHPLTGIPAFQRPSAAVEDSAIRLIRAGWLAYVIDHDGTTHVPSETVDQTYTVRRVLDDDELELAEENEQEPQPTYFCSCMAGMKDVQCKHVTITQFRNGDSLHWEQPEPIRRPEPGTMPRSRAQPAAPATPDLDVVERNGILLFGHSGTGCSRQTWDAIERTVGTARTQQVIRAQIQRTITNPGPGCATCGSELENVGQHSQICGSCGLITPRSKEAAAA